MSEPRRETPIEHMLTPGACRVFSPEPFPVSVHWFPQGSVPGDRCFCGERTQPDEEADDDA